MRSVEVAEVQIEGVIDTCKSGGKSAGRVGAASERIVKCSHPGSGYVYLDLKFGVHFGWN